MKAIIIIMYAFIIFSVGFTQASHLPQQASGSWPFFFGESVITYSPVHDTVLLGSAGGGIGVYDSNLNMLTKISTELGEIKELSVNSELLYVGGQNGIEVYSYAAPHLLLRLSSYQPDLKIKNVFFLGNTVCLILDDNRLQVISFSDSGQLVLHGEYSGFDEKKVINSLTVFKVDDDESSYETLAYVVGGN